MEVWDIKRGQVMDSAVEPRLLSRFDSTKSLYLFEPGASVKEPHYEELSIP